MMQDEAQADGSEKLSKIGMFVDNGCYGPGVISWAKILTHSPQVELHLLNGKDLRNNALNGLDLLLMPGGSGFPQYDSMGPEGADAIRNFISNGGKYLGTCAGLAIALNEPTRLRLIKYCRIMGAMREQGRLAIDLSEKGASMLGIKPGRYMVKYSNGPLAQETDQPDSGDSEVIAVYDSSLGAPGKDRTDHGPAMYGLPAMIHGHYGKGTLLVTSFHPESFSSTHEIALGALFCLTGRTFTTDFPENVCRPIRTAYYASILGDKQLTVNALTIDASPTIDLYPVAINDIEAGVLDHSDVLILPDGDPDVYKKKFSPLHLAMIKRFINRGGLVITSENTKSLVPAGNRHIVCSDGKQMCSLILEHSS